MNNLMFVFGISFKTLTAKVKNSSLILIGPIEKNNKLNFQNFFS